MAAEFSDLTSLDDDDSAAADAIVSQAIDLAVLQQIAMLNTSHLSASSSLPTNLETRFQKLRSFPGVVTRPQKRTSQASTDQHEFPPKNLHQRGKNPSLHSKKQLIVTMKPEDSSPDDASSEAEIMNSDNPPRDELELSPLASLSSSGKSPSPPLRWTCCFGLSLKKSSKKKSNDKILTDFSAFSLKEQQRKLKKALKEEQKASQEAARTIEWVKQASARMGRSAINELESEDEIFK